LKRILDSLASNAELVLKTEPDLNIYVGLFSYDTNYGENDSNKMLNALQKSANETTAQ